MKPKAISAILSTIGVLFMLAGVFQIIPWKYALFLGIACFIITGTIPSIMGKDKGSGDKVGEDKTKPDERIMDRQPE
jgi:hypothetical protein